MLHSVRNDGIEGGIGDTFSKKTAQVVPRNDGFDEGIVETGRLLSKNTEQAVPGNTVYNSLN